MFVQEWAMAVAVVCDVLRVRRLGWSHWHPQGAGRLSPFFLQARFTDQSFFLHFQKPYVLSIVIERLKYKASQCSSWINLLATRASQLLDLFCFALLWNHLHAAYKINAKKYSLNLQQTTTEYHCPVASQFLKLLVWWKGNCILITLILWKNCRHISLLCFFIPTATTQHPAHLPYLCTVD